MKQTHFPFPRIMPKETHVGIDTNNLNAKIRKLADEYRMSLMARAKDENVGIVHIHSDNWPRGGLTVAFRKANEFKSGTMVEVAVNTCSSKDMFSRKLGTTGALTKFFDGETIQLPLLNMYQEEDINWAVKQSFTALWEAI
jgi:hypothetical protein